MKLKLLFPLALLGVVLISAGCNVQSGNDAVRTISASISGFYTNPDGGRMVTQNTGNTVTQMNVTQQGDQLTAIDNNGNIFRGTIGRADESTATFELRGQTTTGQPVTISGNFVINGTTGTMQGTWIEPSLFGSIFGQATVDANPIPAPVTNAGTGTNTNTGTGTNTNTETGTNTGTGTGTNTNTGTGTNTGTETGTDTGTMHRSEPRRRRVGVGSPARRSSGRGPNAGRRVAGAGAVPAKQAAGLDEADGNVGDRRWRPFCAMRSRGRASKPTGRVGCGSDAMLPVRVAVLALSPGSIGIANAAGGRGLPQMGGPGLKPS